MKRKLWLSLVVFACASACSLGLAACGKSSEEEKHTHTYSEEWSSDKDNHWHAADCEHSEEKSDIASHVDADNNGECDVCKYSPMTVTVGGSYYYCEDNVADEQIYITFKNGKWTDDEGLTGDYSVSGNVVTLYMVIGGEKTEFMSGTVSGKDIVIDVMGSDVTYRKGEDADGKPKEKTLSYALSGDRSYYIVKGIGGLTGDIEIPDEYKRKPVKEIAENAFANCKDITSVAIGNNVTSIGKKAFYNCTNLSGAVLGESITEVPDSTFENCGKLTQITIGSDVSRFGEKAFYSCRALKDIHFNGTVADWAQIDFTSNPIYDNNIYIVGNNTAKAQYPSRNLYINGKILKEANITNADHISKSAFIGYTQLEKLTIGGKVEEIGENAFYGCSSLQTLTVTGGVKTIGKTSFRFCEKLSSVVLSDSVNIIGESAFDTCENLTSVNIGNGVKYISDGAFMACAKLSSLNLGSSVAEICEGAFYSCEALTTVTIPSSTIFIGKEAFSYTGLTSATFKSTTGWIANKNDALTSEQLSDTSNAAKLLISSILDKGYVEAEWEKPTLTYTLSNDGTYYIVNNSGSTSRSVIEIPEKYKEKPVRALAQNAFRDCKSLTSISLPGCMLNIPDNAFSGCTSLENITVRGYLVSDYEEVYASSDGILYNADFTKLIYMPLAKSEITVSGVTAVANSRFENNKNLKKVTVGEGVTSIGNYSFMGCDNLAEVTIPASVTRIGEYAFSGCKNLKINYKGSLSDWCKLTIDYAFSDGAQLYINNEKVTNVVIPQDITKLNDYAFSGISGITDVAFHSKLTEIGRSAFYECSSLADVVIPSTVTKIGEYAFNNYDTTLVYCEVSERPSGWSSGWKTGACVIWDYKNNNTDEDGYTYVVVDGIRYALKGSEAKVFKQVSGISRTITIPASVSSKGVSYKVTAIGSYAFANSNLKSITIPATVIGIWQDAFRGCTGLTKLTLADGLTDIGSNAFRDCAGITELSLPSSVKHVGESAFKGCSIEKATVPTVAIPCLDKAYLKSITITSGEKVTGLTNFTALTEITIANGIKGIGDNALYGCTGLTKISLPDSITSIGKEAFSGCVNLTEIKLSNNLISIGSNAFEGCRGLTDIVIPFGVTDIGNQAFYNCSSLSNIQFPDSVKNIGSSVIENTAYFLDATKWQEDVLYVNNHLIKARDISGNYSVKSGTLSIASDAFAYCGSLVSVTIPDSLVAIGDGAFRNCTELTSVNIPNKVTAIAAETFSGCGKLSSITLHNGITEMGNAAFKNCVGLTEFTIPNGVAVIESNLFYGCVNLTGVIIPESVTKIGYDAFWGCSALKNVTIPKSVTSIGNGAFEECSSIVDIIIPDGVAKIDFDTFNRCSSLTNVTIPKSVKVISQTAFNACYGLENVYFKGDIADWCNMEINYYFAGPLRYTQKFYIDNKLVENLVIPETVKEIKEYVFDSCKAFKSITIPASVVSIGERAFQGIDSIIYCEAAQKPNGWDENWAVASDKIIWDCKNNEKDENGYSYTEVGGLNFAIKDGVAAVSSQAKSLQGAIVIPESITYKNASYSVTTISAGAFGYCKSITAVTVPTSIKYIGNEVFDRCVSLEKIYWNAPSCERLDEYSNSTFGQCDKLTTIIFGDKVTAICDRMFSDCDNLTTLTIPEGVTSIGKNAFSYCDSLANITISKGVTSIGEAAFESCASLASVTISEGVTSIGRNAFWGCSSLANITLPDSLVYIGDAAFWGTAYYEDESNWREGVLYIGKHLIDSDNLQSDRYEISEGTLTIADRAFYNKKQLKTLIIPNSVKSICDYAFYNCSGLSELTIPESVTNIGNSVFINSHISYLNYQGTVAQFKAIKKGESWNRSSMGKITVICKDGEYIAD